MSRVFVEGFGTIVTPRVLDLPRTLHDVQYHVAGSPSTETRITVHSRLSRFMGERVDRLDKWKRRKIENLFMLTIPKERTKVRFD